MFLNRRCGSTRISYQQVIVAIIMSLLVGGLTTLVFFLSIAKTQRESLKPIAEPVHFGNFTISAPFGENWSNGTVHPNGTFSCLRYQFACDSSRICLKLEKRCDGHVDCPKAEDELNCACAFRMKPSKFCDKYPDCFDESDESFCSYCPESYFNCGDGKCIPRNQLCDTKVDCGNFMDENFCFKVSVEVGFTDAVRADPVDTTSITSISKTGYLLRNKRGNWYPVCANPVDNMQDALASFACVSITSNPLASSTHELKMFRTSPESYSGDYVYHYNGRFFKWSNCLTRKGIFITCDDIRCGFNPKHLLPKKPQGRIVGGEISEPGTWPWHGAIYKNGSYACGATLITSNWLISAAHCFINYKSNYYEVQLGMLRRKSFTPHQKIYRIDRVVPHQKFRVITLEFDIVMLRIADPVVFDFWVRPICLPDPKKAESSGSYCTAIGWGDIGEMEDDSEDLQEVHVPIIKSCKKDMDRWLCAGYVEGGRDACQGDSGGPLMCLREDGISWYIAGVISGGKGCARPKTPGMYTRVVYFLDWIQQVMINQNRASLDFIPLPTCPGWKCAAVGGGNCLTADRVCDGHVDCYDAQDEANCTSKKNR